MTLKVALIAICILLPSHPSAAADPAKICGTIKVGDAERTMISKWEGVAKKAGVLTWGGTGNHRLILALPDGEQIAFEVAGPYLSNRARVTAIGEIEPLEDWKSFPGIEVVALSANLKPKLD